MKRLAADKLMSKDRHATAPNLVATAGGVQYAYRRFGSRGGPPLLLLNCFAANLDAWDPKITDGFASDREVILLDGAGIGRSSGETPSTVAAMTEGCYQFCQALGLQSLDIVGFSLGGMIAQQLAFDYPDLVRRMILLGTGPRGGEGMTFTELSTEDLADPVTLLKSALFTPSVDEPPGFAVNTPGLARRRPLGLLTSVDRAFKRFDRC